MRFSRHSFFISIFVALLLQTGVSQALGLLDAYEAALENDPVYRSAIHENEAPWMMQNETTELTMPIVTNSETMTAARMS